MKTVYTIAGLSVLALIGYFAAIGAACLYMTAPITPKETCDDIRQISGYTWCMTLMSPGPLLEAPTEPTIQTTPNDTANPQKTIDGKELQ